MGKNIKILIKNNIRDILSGDVSLIPNEDDVAEDLEYWGYENGKVGPIKEYDETVKSPFNEKLIKLLRFIFTLKKPKNADEFTTILWSQLGLYKGMGTHMLYFVLRINSFRTGYSIIDMLNKFRPEEYFIPKIYESEVTFKSEYNSYSEDDECEDGTGYYSGQECDCLQYEEIEITKKDDDGDEYSEWVDCWNATGKELEQQGYDDKYDCECEDWELQEIEWYYYNEISETILSSEDPGNEQKDWYNYGIDEYKEASGDYITTEREENEGDDDRQTWEYFRDDEEGEILDSQVTEWDTFEVADEIKHLIEQIDKNNNRIREQYEMTTQREKKRLGLTSEIFNVLDNTFSIKQHPEGELSYGGKNMALYSYDLDGFVPLEEIYQPIKPLIQSEINQEDIDIFVEIITDWLNSRMTIKPTLYEQEERDAITIKKFLTDFWPKHRSQLYRDLYNTYHPSAYVESFNRPSSQFENALETIADAVHEGKKLGLIDSSVHWSDIYDYESRDRAAIHQNVDSEDFLHPGIDDDGIPTLNNQLEIIDNTNLDWIHGILLFDVLEDIVDEFKSYCGENGVDESGMGKCMDEFPPSPNHEQINRTGGTLKQDYYTLFNFMRELERAGIPVSEYMRSPLFPSIIKLVDDGTTDYNEVGGERTSEDWDNMRTQTEFEMDAPDRVYEQVDPEEFGIIDGEKKDIPDGYPEEEEIDRTPFTRKEVSILNALYRNLTYSELVEITDTTPSNYGKTQLKYWEVMKLFGITVSRDNKDNARAARYAKWAVDNWNDAKAEDGDYSKLSAPIRVPLKWYDVARTESGSQIEYKSGDMDILAWNEEDAEEKADMEWYDWGAEMETHDYGDYEMYDSVIDSVEFKGLDESIRRILREEVGELDNRTKALISIGGIQRDKVTTPIFIKNIFKSSGHEAKSSGVEPEDGGEWNRFYIPGTNIDLDADLQRIRDRIRFEEYGEMFQQGIEGRGFAFEGMLAGLFNGEPMKAGGKEDIKVGDDYYSIKQSNPGDAWDTGSLQKGYDYAKESMEDDVDKNILIDEDGNPLEIPQTPVDLMVAGDEFIPYKTEMLLESFKSSRGKPLKWIFAHVLSDKQIEYVSMDSDELISAILSSDCSKGTGSRACAVGKSRKKDTGIRIKSHFIMRADPKLITFPSVSDEDIRSIIYDPEGDRIEDRIRRIFKDPNKVSQYTVEYIRDNPKDFQDAVNREIPNLTTEERTIAYNLLLEETDVFGQGLLDPIKPEEFEGTDEEWEELTASINDDDIRSLYDYKQYEYTGEKTDPAKGFVAPSAEVTNNICNVEGFCEAQGPITFGQLKALVEEATKKRIQADIGRGVFKTLWRIIPFFVPQILLAAVGVTVTRAFNKIITPALTDTRGYKEWWGKLVLKAMDVAEGDYVPDIALGDDPLSKIFFISDGLMQMIRDKYKLKFARYVTEVAASKSDNEPVPDWFVENLLRDYLNQKFLLDPPLPVKHDIEPPVSSIKKEHIEQSKNIIENEEKELEEYCPMGNPNKCIPVDYDDLPDMIHEDDIPEPGSTSAEGFDDSDLPYETRYMNLSDILSDIKNIAYYQQVLDDIKKGPDEDGRYDWDTTNTVIRYANHWMDNPESLTGPDFPPIQVIGDGMKDGSHRVSTLYALANHIDPKNTYWKDVELEVRVYDPEIVMDSGHFYPWLYDIPGDRLQDVIDKKSVYNWETLKKWKESQESLKEHKKKDKNPFGFIEDDWKDEILTHEKNLSTNELKYKKLADQLNGMTVTIPVDIHDGAEPVIGTTDITFTIVRPFIFQGLRGDFFDNMRPSEDYKDNPKRPTVIKYDLVFRGVEPGSILEELLDENSLEGMDIHNISARERLIELLVEESYNINESLMKNYFKLYGATIGRLGNIYDSKQLQEQRYAEREVDDKFTDVPSDDSKLNVTPASLWKFLEVRREEIKKELFPSLSCVEYNCYEGWKDDPDNEWDEDDMDFDEQAQEHCSDCGEELNNTLEKLDKDLLKLGLIEEDPIEGYLQKPFPYSYNLWIDKLIKEINPRFYVDSDDNISYDNFKRVELEEDGETNEAARTLSKARKAGVDTYYPKSAVKANPERFRKYTRDKYLNEHNQPGLSPELEVDDIIRVIEVDGEHARMPKRWGVYKVVKVGQSYDEYYDITPYPDVESRVTRHYKELGAHHQDSDFTLYRGDTWIYADVPMVTNVDRKTLGESEEEMDPGEGIQTRGPFTKVDIQILNYLAKEFTWEELNTISSVDDTQIVSKLENKWRETIKLFGEYPTQTDESWIKSSRWAKWAVENWNEARRNDDDGDIDFSRVTDPIKSWPSWFEVEADESYWQKEYRSGSIELGAYDRDDAEERADMSWWDYDPEMEYYDSGDSDDHVLDINNVKHMKTLNESIMDDIPLEQFKEDNPEVVEILDRFPETLQRELAVERKNPQEFVEDFKNYHLTSPAPNIEDSESTTITLRDELNKEHTIDTLSRTPQDVVDVVNEVWGTDFESVKVFDPNPARYFEYAKFPGDTAKPSLMVNGKILYGVARFVAALLRGDETMEVWDITQKENITEHEKSKVNPDLEEGDKILVVNRRPAPPGVREPLPGHTPDLFTTYVVIEKKYTGHKAKHPYHYFILPEDKYDVFINDPYAREVDDLEKSLFPWVHDWILDKEDIINEHKESKLNPELMVGDEIMVVSTEGIHDFGAPELYKPYVVVGIKHGTTMMKGGKELEDYPYYQIEPIGETDKERLGHMLAGGGRRKPMYIFPRQDQWILRPGFLRGETWVPKPEAFNEHNEHKESKLNPQLMVGDEITVVDVDESFGTMNTPKRFQNYVVTGINQPSKQYQPRVSNEELYYHLEPIGGYSDDEATGRMLSGGGKIRDVHLYSSDKWVLRKGFLRGELYEHDQFVSHSYEPSVGDKIVNNNPGCVHYRSEGIINNVDNLSNEAGRTITYIVTNDGDSFKKGDSLTKTMDQLTPINEHVTKKVLNPDVMVGDVIELIYMDDPWDVPPPATKGVVVGFPDKYKIMVRWIMNTDNPDNPEFKTIPLLLDKDVYRLAKRVEKPEEENNEEDTNEATGASSAGGYSAPLFGQFKSKGKSKPKKSMKLHNFFEGKAQIVFKRKLTEALEPEWSIRRGRQHYAMNQPSDSGEPVAAMNDYLVKNSPFNYMGFDYYLSAVPGRMPDSALIDVFVPMLDTGKNADELWSGKELTYYVDLSFGYEYEDDPEEGYIKQNKPLHDIGHNEKYEEHYAYNSFVDNHPDQAKYKWGDIINEPGAAYEFSWRKRFSILLQEMEELSKLFNIDEVTINRDVNYPWRRTADSYGNENIRPGNTVPRDEIRYGEVVKEEVI